MTYIIGDIHGCFFTLKKLISKIPKDAKVIFVGDLCDKGNFTKEVISFIKDKEYLVVKGNHEIFMETFLLDSLIENKKSLWSTSETYGGSKTIDSYKDVDLSIVNEHLDFIKKFPLYLIIDNYFITHGFGLPYFNRRDEAHKALVSNRVERVYSDWEDFSDYKFINIFGHSAFNEVVKHSSFFGIDTGCVYGNKLSAIELGSHNIISEDVDPRDIS